MSDRVLILNQGQISQYATPQEIIHQPNNSFGERVYLKSVNDKSATIFMNCLVCKMFRKGKIEAKVILAAVILLFTCFLVVQ